MGGGLSTSVAVLCHELPHEVGDFAVLLKAGLSVKKAVMYNTLSAFLCFLGMTIGVVVGNLDTGMLSSIIAGMFLYIALVDMIPQLDCCKYSRCSLQRVLQRPARRSDQLRHDACFQAERPAAGHHDRRRHHGNHLSLRARLAAAIQLIKLVLHYLTQRSKHLWCLNRNDGNIFASVHIFFITIIFANKETLNSTTT